MKKGDLDFFVILGVMLLAMLLGLLSPSHDDGEYREQNYAGRLS
jgi:hypothetical protein